MKSSILCVAVAATIALVHGVSHTAADKNAKECELNYLNESSVISITTAERCEALVRFSKCLSAFDSNLDAENKLFNQNTKACEPYWNSIDAPVLRTTRGNLEMTVDNAKDVKFHRHRRDTISVFEMNQKVTELLAEVQKLKNANVQLKAQAEEQRTTFENQLAAKSAELDEKSTELETKLTQKVDDAKESLDNNIVDLQDKVDTSASDVAKALDDFRKNATATTQALSRDIVATVDTKLKPFEGTDKVLANLKNSYLSDPKIPVYRIGKWWSYNPRVSWFDSNSPDMFGGVNPSRWSDGNARADMMANNWKQLKALFTKKETADKYGANMCSEAYGQFTSTTGFTCGVIFRIKNTGTRSVRWAPAVTMTSWHGWSETASISLNGNNLIGNRDCNHMCRFSPSMDIPANSAGNRISTVIFISTGSYEYNHYSRWRATLLIFRANSLALPNGLEYVDDMDVLEGPWKQ